MDLESIGIAWKALGAAKDLGTALIELRDFNQIATTTAKLNEEILKAQQSLFLAQAKMFELQTQCENAAKENGELRKRLEQRAAYELIELSRGVFVYRLKLIDHGVDGGVHANEPVHHVCQACMDGKGLRSILQRVPGGGTYGLRCNECRVDYPTDERMEPLAFPKIHTDF